MIVSTRLEEWKLNKIYEADIISYCCSDTWISCEGIHRAPIMDHMTDEAAAFTHYNLRFQNINAATPARLGIAPNTSCSNKEAALYNNNQNNIGPFQHSFHKAGQNNYSQQNKFNTCWQDLLESDVEPFQREVDFDLWPIEEHREAESYHNDGYEARQCQSDHIAESSGNDDDEFWNLISDCAAKSCHNDVGQYQSDHKMESCSNSDDEFWNILSGCAAKSCHSDAGQCQSDHKMESCSNSEDEFWNNLSDCTAQSRHNDARQCQSDHKMESCSNSDDEFWNILSSCAAKSCHNESGQCQSDHKMESCSNSEDEFWNHLSDCTAQSHHNHDDEIGQYQSDHKDKSCQNNNDKAEHLQSYHEMESCHNDHDETDHEAKSCRDVAEQCQSNHEVNSYHSDEDEAVKPQSNNDTQSNSQNESDESDSDDDFEDEAEENENEHHNVGRFNYEAALAMYGPYSPGPVHAPYYNTNNVTNGSGFHQQVTSCTQSREVNAF